MKLPFYFIDVFADAPLNGNPLAVVPHADELSLATMQQIAAELNQAETTFIVRPNDSRAHWRLRSLTAVGHEVFGAGHNSLGAWWWLADAGTLNLHEGENDFIQEIGPDLLPVTVRVVDGKPASILLTQSPPEFGNIERNLDALANALGLERSDLNDSLPAQVVSTGAGHLLVPVKTRSVVSRTRPDTRVLAELLAAIGGEGCYVYSLDPIAPTSAAHARFFNPTMGIAEDAATGTAAGPLACQLVKHGVASDDSTIQIEQGYDMKRPSILAVEVEGQTVRLAGRAVQSIEGYVRIA